MWNEYARQSFLTRELIEDADPRALDRYTEEVKRIPMSTALEEALHPVGLYVYEEIPWAHVDAGTTIAHRILIIDKHDDRIRWAHDKEDAALIVLEFQYRLSRMRQEPWMDMYAGQGHLLNARFDTLSWQVVKMDPTKRAARLALTLIADILERHASDANHQR